MWNILGEGEPKFALRKHAHALYRKFLVVKMKISNGKILIFFLIFAQNIDCGYTLEPPRRGGSNEYPQSMLWSKNKKNRYTPHNPVFFYIKAGFKGVYISRTCFPDGIKFINGPFHMTKITDLPLKNLLWNRWTNSNKMEHQCFWPIIVYMTLDDLDLFYGKVNFGRIGFSIEKKSKITRFFKKFCRL